MHGKAVSYDEANINAYYHTPGMVDDDELMQYRERDLDWDQVIITLCRSGVMWMIKGTEAVSFSDKELN